MSDKRGLWPMVVVLLFVMSACTRQAAARHDEVQQSAEYDEVKQLTACGGQCMSAAWSPDENQIAYFDGSQEGVSVINLDSSKTRALAQLPAFIPLWSPDGTHIALLPHVMDPVLSVVGADGGGLVRLSDDVSTAVWSPDSQHIAFIDVARSELFLVHRDGTDLQSLFKDTTATVKELMWSPDNGQIYVVLKSADGILSIDLVNVDGSGTTRLMTLPDEAYEDEVAVSPDGRWAAFISEDLERIEIMKTDGTDLHVLVDQPIIGELVWSPDSKQIAFTSFLEDEADIYVTNVDGSGLVNVTNLPGFNEARPIWSPSGSRLAFDVNAIAEDGFISGATEIYTVDVPGP